MNPVIVRNVAIGEGIPKICVPIVEQTKEEILEAAKAVTQSPADLVEWRADFFEAVFDIEAVKAVLAELRNILCEMPLLFTFRTKNEGGEKEISFPQYGALLKEVAATGLADLIDVEVYFHEMIPELIAELKQMGIVVVGSNHDFEKTPQKREIIQTLGYMQFIGADIPKIAVMPQNERDVLTLLYATQEMVSQYADRPIITMSMAGLGSVSRICGETFGSAVTFGALKKSSAPGQIDVVELKKILETLHGVQ